MTSAAAKREEIQLKLQELRERREREQAAFDVIAAAHPELSAQEVAALAQQHANKAIPQQSLMIDGAEVCVGNRVTVKDDLHLLHRADRGYFGPDVLKPVYLGERGEVLRVMASFQGKPAVELRFADGVTKVFFAECIETDTARAGGARGGAHLDLADVPVFVPPMKAPAAPPRAEALPGWGQLAMPHRRLAGGNARGVPAPAAASPPPPPATAATTRTSAGAGVESNGGLPAPAVAKPSNAVSPALSSVLRVAPTEATNSEVTQSSPHKALPPPIMKEAPAKVRRASSSARQDASPTSAPSSLSSSSAAVSFTKRPHVVASPSPISSSPHVTQDFGKAAPPSTAETSPQDEGAKMTTTTSTTATTAGGLRAPPSPYLGKAAQVSTEDDMVLAPRPQSDSLATDVGTRGADRRLPQTCAATYQAKYELQDGASRIPRSQSSPTTGTRTCWVCGLMKTDAVLSEPVRVVFQSQCTAMFSLFAVLTRKLQWDKMQCTASRLFTERGVEIKTASAVRDGMRLVATTGCEYRAAAHADAFDSVVEGRPASANPAHAAELRKGPEALASPPAGKKTPVLHQRKSLLSGAAAPVTISSFKQDSATTSSSSRSPAATPTASAVVTPSAANKHKHIRVYENGLYDDNIYRTVTVRPTYKTLAALKTTITRELQWRDGKKVDVLFDACGAEISDLHAICDGDVVVASAGDRFVIPYPNTPMHLEAMKLSERLEPSRKC